MANLTTPEKKNEIKQKNINDVEIVFPKVYKLVEEGQTISQALKRLSFSSSKFYKYISIQKNQLLKTIKISNSKYGCYYKYNKKIN
jgi:hypothetical protein